MYFSHIEKRYYSRQVQFAYSPRLEINLKKVLDKESLMQAMYNVEHLRGEANIGAALQYVRQQGFSDESTRRNTPKVCIKRIAATVLFAWKIRNDKIKRFVRNFSRVVRTALG